MNQLASELIMLDVASSEDREAFFKHLSELGKLVSKTNFKVISRIIQIATKQKTNLAKFQRKK